MNENEQLKALLSQAFAAVLGSSAALLTVWRGAITDDDQGKLAECEARGWRLGIAVVMPEDRYIIQVTVLDPTTKTTRVFNEMLQPGAQPTSVN